MDKSYPAFQSCTLNSHHRDEVHIYLYVNLLPKLIKIIHYCTFSVLGFVCFFWLMPRACGIKDGTQVYGSGSTES